VAAAWRRKKKEIDGRKKRGGRRKKKPCGFGFRVNSSVATSLMNLRGLCHVNPGHVGSTVSTCHQ
jgi:hypothetical protein